MRGGRKFQPEVGRLVTLRRFKDGLAFFSGLPLSNVAQTQTDRFRSCFLGVLFMNGPRQFTAFTALCVIIANMIGTGVFTSLGFQLVGLQSGFVLILLWIAGGLAALCGAICYAELGAALPRSGGEYNFLSRIFHPGLGFAAGWISALIGFSAPIALAAMTFAAYGRAAFFPDQAMWFERGLAAGLVLALCLVHAGRRKASGSLQIVFTVLKIVTIVAFCVFAIGLASPLQPISFWPQPGDVGSLTSAAFAVSLIYVSYAYTGWNAATYLSSELESPQQNLPRVLIGGTLIVMTLYVALNAVFLLVAPVADMVGKIEIGIIAARAAFGDGAAQLAGLVLALLLISTVSAMTIAGPRVLQMIGEDLRPLRALAKTNSDGVPARAIFLQSGLALLFILTSTFDAVLVFSGFTLALVSFVTVLGLLVLRWREPDLPRPFRVSAFPLPPLVYLSLTGWTLVFVALDRPAAALAGLGLVGSGLLVYGLLRLQGRSAKPQS